MNAENCDFQSIKSIDLDRNLRLMNFYTPNTELRALISLLDDPDSGVYENVSSRLVAYGKTIIPHLETVWEYNAKNGIQNRVEEIIQQIEFEVCSSTLASWKNNGCIDLFEGAIKASLFQYPNQETDLMLSQIELLRKDVWLELNENLTSLEKIRVLNHILYDVHHFGSYIKYWSSDQSWFLYNVLEHKKGSPTAMAILYKSLADKLELPVVGINLPDHFILGYKDLYNHTGDELLFYINPFSKGAVFGKGELERYIQKMNLEVSVEELRPMNNQQIIKRYLTDLKSGYRKLNRYRKLDQVDQLLRIF